MNNSYSDPVRKNAPALVVLLVCCLLTTVAFLSEQRYVQERASFHTSADAAQFQRTLQKGIDSYLHLNRDLAAYFTAAPRPDARALRIYMRTADVLRQNPGLSYVGYIGHVDRKHWSGFERSARPKEAEPKPRFPGADPTFSYPYLYAYPPDARSGAAQGTDASAIPERWAAMQKARDSGETTATAKHIYIAGREAVPVIAAFTPIYEPELPIENVAQRRVALRGFVFSIFHIQEMIERVTGNEFHALFDLAIFDGAVRADTLLYDGDKEPHWTMINAELPTGRRAEVKFAGRDWQLLFFPKPAPVNLRHGWFGMSILALGLAISAAFARLTSIWTRRLWARSRKRGEGLQFDAVFAHHPSAVYELDLRRRIIHANAQALKEFNMEKGDLIGRAADDFVAPENGRRSKEWFAETLRGNAVSYDSAIIDGAGARIELSVILIPVKVGSEVTSVLGIARNITAQKLGEWRLKESRNMLQLVINHLPQRVFWKDTNFAFLGCNEAAARDAGLGHPDDIVGRTDFDLAWRASAHLYRQDDRETLSSGQAKINFEESQSREDGSVSWLRTSKIPLTDQAGETIALLGMYEDITERKQLEQKLHEMAHHDALTGLANRAFFYEYLDLAMSKERRHDSLLALMYFDIDQFKSINDMYGHDGGDTLLKAFAARVSGTVREIDVFARLGGDEFALLLEDLPDRETAERVAAMLVEVMQTPFQIGERTVAVTSSIGIAFVEEGMRPDGLIQRADQAMYHAKRAGRNRFAIACADSVTDIAQQIPTEKEIERLAFYDRITGLPNRLLLLDRVQRALTITGRGRAAGALLFIDLDHFKTINDTLGHDKGDMLLQRVATRLRASVFEIDTVARLGSDEFVILVENLSEDPHQAATRAKRICEKIILALGEPMKLEQFVRYTSASIGVTMFDSEQCEASELLTQAELAMCEVKAAGRNGVRFFDPEMQTVVNTRAALEADLRDALQHDEFLLHFQPQVDRDGVVVGAEALVRWQSPTRGLVAPASFIPIAEATGLILPIGRWVLEQACGQLANWAQQPEFAALSISVNVSAHQLHQSCFVDDVLALLADSGANPHRLKLEITETLLLGDTEATIAKMRSLKAHGVGFSLDDFGTGYSSLSYLKRLPLDQLKIDQSFVNDLTTDANDSAIVQTVLSLGRCLGLNVIAEGVETAGQHAFLMKHGCHAFQGYHFSRPVAVACLERFARARQVLLSATTG